MMSKTILVGLLFLLAGISCSFAQEQKAQESDQQISDFSLSGYGDQGAKSWELNGKSADIFTDVVKLQDITGNMYGKEENIKLTSDSGDFNKSEGKIHLQDNVVITTTSGAKLTTDSLDWDRKNQFVSTKDKVNIDRENMQTTATGANGQPNLNKVNLEKDVVVQIKPEKEQPEALGKDKVMISCDGPLEIDYEKNVAVFQNNVKVDRDGSQIYCDKMNVYFLRSVKKEVLPETTPLADSPETPDKSLSGMGNTQIERLVCRGNVKIVRGENVSYSDEAVYTGSDKKIVLSGRPRLILYSSEDLSNASLGN
jgi:LPS export ABC transporter protein LptC